jgi:predicted thioesterase
VNQNGHWSVALALNVQYLQVDSAADAEEPGRAAESGSVEVHRQASRQRSPGRPTTWMPSGLNEHPCSGEQPDQDSDPKYAKQCHRSMVLLAPRRELQWAVPMKSSLQVGNMAEVQVLVTEDMCPAFDGVLVHRVYSTWSMAHHMELAARKVLAPHLDDGEEGIGGHLSIDHLAPATVGATVQVRAEAIAVDDAGVTCEVTAWEGDTLLGRGRQVQRVLPKSVLAKLIDRAARRGASERAT